MLPTRDDWFLMFVFPLKTVSEANVRSHPQVRAKRVREQKEATAMYAMGAGLHGLSVEARPLCITLTRMATKKLDSDNLAGSMKAVRDALAHVLRLDDGDDEAAIWEYGQEKSKARDEYLVRVEVCSAASKRESARAVVQARHDAMGDRDVSGS